jgi:uncharacterized protein
MHKYALALLLVLSLLPWGVPAVKTDAAQDGCGADATAIHTIQGDDLRSPMIGERIVIEGVVVADFQDPFNELGGFFVQEEAADIDDDPLTSEGIFVNDANNRNSIDVAVGDVVRIEGSVNEITTDFVAMTQLRNIRAMTVCASGASVAPTPMTMPVAEESDWERVEGMLVSIPQALIVAENYNLGRFGQVMLTYGDRMYIPTNVARPGPDADAVMQENSRRRIFLDDGSSAQNPDPVPYPPSGLTALNTLRSGDQIADITGVIEHSYGFYRVHPVAPVTLITENPRPDEPPAVGGEVTVAAFNVLNYFNGNGQGGDFPTPRGARTPEEFERQNAKIVAALLALDADVIGLMEIENDGDGPDSAVATLVDELNAVAGDGTYAYVPDPDGFELPIENSREGGDEIKVAMIYRPARVTPVGDSMTTTAPPFDQRRPSLAQTFDSVADGERFTVVVNHFKSKGCSGAGSLDRAQGDGQGCFNAERTQAALTLIAWLANDPTGSGDPDVLIIGDLNAYGMEDPLMAFQGAGYVNLLKKYLGTRDYSYIYYGEAGTLDHILASASLDGQVSGAAVWHINADEPRVLDYTMNYKTDAQHTTLYDDGPFRSSDHDPVLVGLNLGD